MENDFKDDQGSSNRGDQRSQDRAKAVIDMETLSGMLTAELQIRGHIPGNVNLEVIGFECHGDVIEVDLKIHEQQIN